MRHSIATVCLSGLLPAKLEAAAAAGFHGVEIFENDLLQHAGTAREVRQRCADLGLAIDMFQPFRDFDAASPAQLARNLVRAQRKFDLMAELGTELILVCSNVQPDAVGDVAVLAEQFQQLAELAAQRGIRISYEALAWGTQVKLASQAWGVVQAVDRANFGLTLDSFHTLSLRDDPGYLRAIPGDRIFFMQLADAPWVPTTDVLLHSRHYRCFPGQGEFDVTGFVRAAVDAGYTGPWSLEVFNDEFRSAPTQATAVDARRSLLWLEEQVAQAGAALQPAPSRAVPVSAQPSTGHALFTPPAPSAFSGWSFVEFAVDVATAQRLTAVLQALGFALIGQHRSKAVDLWGQGELRIVLNLEEDSFARGHFERHGPSVCALALACSDAQAAVARAQSLLCPRVDGRVGPGELTLPGVAAPDGSLLYFCASPEDGRHAFERDFVIDEAALATAHATSPLGAGARIDHLAQAVPGGQVEPWLLFYRAVLGLKAARSTVLNDPFGVMRSREIESADPAQAIRCSLMVSERENTLVARSRHSLGGGGVQQIAIAVPDLLATVAELKRRGAPLLPVPANYYEDLEARYDLAPDFLAALREHGVLFERGADGQDFLHAYSLPFEDRFEFEFVERRGGYALYGASNAPVRLAAVSAWRARRDAAQAADTAP